MPITYSTERFEVDNETLCGCYAIPISNPIGEILFLHGGKRATKERMLPLALTLAESYSVSSFSFDNSGHGASTGSSERKTLDQRIKEAQAALAFSQFRMPVAVLGFSMGASVAVELAGRVPVKSLILFSPAVYPVEAYNVPFGDAQYTSIVQAPTSWLSSPVLQGLESFRGRVLLVAGEYDPAVETGLLEVLQKSASNALESRLIVVPRAHHRLLNELFRSNIQLREICVTIEHFVS